jgi:hypothetical protein
MRDKETPHGWKDSSGQTVYAAVVVPGQPDLKLQSEVLMGHRAPVNTSGKLHVPGGKRTVITDKAVTKGDQTSNRVQVMTVCCAIIVQAKCVVSKILSPASIPPQICGNLNIL